MADESTNTALTALQTNALTLILQEFRTFTALATRLVVAIEKLSELGPDDPAIEEDMPKNKDNSELIATMNGLREALDRNTAAHLADKEGDQVAHEPTESGTETDKGEQPKGDDLNDKSLHDASLTDDSLKG